MKKNKGFTLLEMLVVIIIIFVLATVGKLSYDVSVEKSKYSEFYSMITAIKDAQRAYFVEHQRYAESIFDLGLDVNGVEEHGLKDDLFKNGEGLRTKYFIYGTRLSTGKGVGEDGGNRNSLLINVCRYTGDLNFNSKSDYLYISLYFFDYPVESFQSEKLSIGSKSKIKKYVFKQMLKPIVSNWQYLKI